MRYVSVCSGIEAATVAWRPVLFAEIEKFPSLVLAHRYPEVPNVGDFTKIEKNEHESVDVLVGGTPCQDFSVAGLRAGLDGKRGQLTVEFAKLAGRLRPRWLVWENVPGVLSIDGGAVFGTLLGMLGQLGYGFAYRVLDAQYLGVPQRRRRVFVVGYLGDWRRAAAVLFERQSLSGDTPPRRETGKDVAPTISARIKGGGGLGTDFDCDGGLIAGTLSPGAHPGGYNGQDAYSNQLIAFGGNNTAGAIDIATACNAHGGSGRMDFESETLVTAPLTQNPYADNKSRESLLVTHALRADGFDASEDGTGRGTPLVPVASAVRRLTPRECERLQGFPDDYTLISPKTADGPRYKALGNSMAVPVMRWIGERIAMADAL
jgi:DNA (cytosine-5)-methyltransferase 1